ncbi:MAG: DUF6483 family protein [Lachnospiraceae bacterium]
MYEQDYMMRLNREIIRTITELTNRKSTRSPFDEKVHDSKETEKIVLDLLYGQVDLGQINEAENELYSQIYNNDSRALEKALLFYSYLNDKNDEFLLVNNYSREEIQEGLRDIASRYGLDNVIDIMLE